jgi:hypothetical protein
VLLVAALTMLTMASCGQGSSQDRVRAVGSSTMPSSSTAPADAPENVVAAFRGEILDVPPVIQHSPATLADVLAVLDGQQVPPQYAETSVDVYFVTGSFQAQPGPGAASTPTSEPETVASVVIVTSKPNGDVIFGAKTPIDLSDRLPKDGSFST